MDKNEILIMLYRLLQYTGVTVDDDEHGENGYRVVDLQDLLNEIQSELEKTGKKFDRTRLELK